MAEIKNVQVEKREIKKPNAKVTQPKADRTKDVKVFGNLTTSGKVKPQSDTEDKKVKNNISAFGSLTTSSKESATKSSSTIFANRLESAQNKKQTFGTSIADIAESEGRELTHKELTDAQIEEMQNNKREFGTASFGISTLEAEAVAKDNAETLKVTSEAMQQENAQKGRLDISDGMGFGAFEDSAPQSEAICSKSKKVISNPVLAGLNPRNQGSFLRQVNTTHYQNKMLSNMVLNNLYGMQGAGCGYPSYYEPATSCCSGGRKSKKDNSWIVGLVAGLGGLAVGVAGTLGIMALFGGSGSESTKSSGGGNIGGGSSGMSSPGSPSSTGGTNALPGASAAGTEQVKLQSSKEITNGLDVDKPTQPQLFDTNQNIINAEHTQSDLIGENSRLEGYKSGLNAKLDEDEDTKENLTAQLIEARDGKKNAKGEYEEGKKGVAGCKADVRSAENALETARRNDLEAREKLATAKKDYEEAEKGVQKLEGKLTTASSATADAKNAYEQCPEEIEDPNSTTTPKAKKTNPKKAELKAEYEKRQQEEKEIKLQLEQAEKERDAKKTTMSEAQDAVTGKNGTEGKIKTAEETLTRKREALKQAEQKLGEIQGKLKQLEIREEKTILGIERTEAANEAIQAEVQQAEASQKSVQTQMAQNGRAISSSKNTYKQALSNWEKQQSTPEENGVDNFINGLSSSSDSTNFDPYASIEDTKTPDSEKVSPQDALKAAGITYNFDEKEFTDLNGKKLEGHYTINGLKYEFKDGKCLGLSDGCALGKDMTPARGLLPAEKEKERKLDENGKPFFGYDKETKKAYHWGVPAACILHDKAGLSYRFGENGEYLGVLHNDKLLEVEIPDEFRSNVR